MMVESFKFIPKYFSFRLKWTEFHFVSSRYGRREKERYREEKDILVDQWRDEVISI